MLCCTFACVDSPHSMVSANMLKRAVKVAHIGLVEEFEPPSMKDQIRLGLYDFPPQYWDDISEDGKQLKVSSQCSDNSLALFHLIAKDLIKGLLTVDPTKRLTADDALKHKWMSQDVSITYTVFTLY